MTAWGVSEGRSRISRLSFRVPSAPCTAIWTGIMRAVAPNTPRIAASRSSVNAPMGAPVVDDLEGVHGRGQRCHHFRRGHGQRNRPGLKDGMAAGQQLPGINIGNGCRLRQSPDRRGPVCALTAEPGCTEAAAAALGAVFGSEEPLLPPAATASRPVPAIFAARGELLQDETRS